MKCGFAWVENRVDGHTVVCHCGWRTGEHRQRLKAEAELDEHVKENA